MKFTIYHFDDISCI